MASQADKEQKAGETPDETIIVDKVTLLSVESSATIVELDPVKVEKTTMPAPKPNATKEQKKEDPPPKSDPPPPEKPEEKEESPPPKESEAPHYGEHSVEPTDVIKIDVMQAGAKIGQNIVETVSGAVRTLRRRFDYQVNNQHMSFVEPLLWSRPFGLSLSWDARGALAWLVQPIGNQLNTTVQTVPATVKGSFRLADQPGILNSGAPDLNMVVKTIRGTSRMSKPIAERLCSRIDVNLEVTDLSGFFTSGFFFAGHLQYFETAGIQPVWGALPANCVIVANIAAVEDNAVNVAIAALELALNEQALAFEYRRLTANDLSLILSIAIGGSNSVTAPVGAEQIPITSFVTWPERKFLLWSENDIALPDVRIHLTAANVRTSLAAIAKLLDCYDDYVSGFIRAGSLLVMKSITWTGPLVPAPAPRPPTPPPGPSRQQRSRRSSSTSVSLSSSTDSLIDRIVNLKVKQQDHAKKQCKPVPPCPLDSQALMLAYRVSGEPDSDAASYNESGDGDPEGDQMNAMMAGLMKELSSKLVEEHKKKHSKQKPPDPEPDPPPYQASIRVRTRGLVHSMLECGVVQVQYTRGHNFMFDIMRIKKPERVHDRHTIDDGRFLAGMNSDEQMRTCLMIGGLLSVAAGTVMNSINITGREINLWAQGVGAKSTDLLRPVFSATQNGRTAPYFQLVVGAFQQLVEGNLSPNFIRGASMFSGGGHVLAELNNNDSWWRSLWARRVPYLLEPASMSWAYKGFADVWGYYGPNPKVEFKHDIVVGGANNEEYISFHRDEHKYIDQAGSNQPFKYIPYGGFSINILRQHVGALDPWLIQIRLVKSCASGTGEVEPPVINIWQPRFVPNMGVMEAGSLLTYDWARDAQIVPGLTKDALGDDVFFEITRMPSQVLPGVGLIRDLRKIEAPTPSSFLGLLPGIQGLDNDGEDDNAGSASGN